MNRFVYLAVSMALASAGAWAGSARPATAAKTMHIKVKDSAKPNPPKQANDAAVSACPWPSTEAVQIAQAKASAQGAVFGPGNAQVMVDYDAAGRINDTQVVRSSGDLGVDRAIVSWVRRARLCDVKSPGRAVVPFPLKTEETSADQVSAAVSNRPVTNDLRASLCAQPSSAGMNRVLQSYMAKSPGAKTIVGRVFLSFENSGRVTDARIQASTGVEEIDNAMLQWGADVKICPGVAGAGTIPIVFNTGD